MRELRVVILLLVAAMALSGCGEPGAVREPGTSQNSTSVTASPATVSAKDPAGESSAWPSYIPGGIPPLDANIRKVMEGQTHVRIFYQDLSREQIDDYLRLLEGAGFHLEYLVYYDERYPDNPETKRRMEEGDYDAVDITKGEYHLNLGYVPGDTTLDVYTTGWEAAYPYAPDTDWPAALTGVIPQPERCRVEAVYTRESGPYSHQIVCTPESDGAVAAYVEALQAEGFLPVQTQGPAVVDPASMYPDIYGKAGVAVTVDYPPSVGTFRITVWRVP